MQDRGQAGRLLREHARRRRLGPRVVPAVALAALATLAAAALARAVTGPAAAGPSEAAAPVAPAPAARPAPAPTAIPRGPDRLLEDGEFVYGPEVGGFDTAAVLAARAPDLAHRSEPFRGRQRAVSEVIDRVALEHSLSPRVLIALLTAEGPPAPGALASRLQTAAAWLADGYYGLKYRGERSVTFTDGTSRPGPVDVTAAHFAVARYLALGTDPASWAASLSAFARTYDELFGPRWRTLPAPVPPGAAQPVLRLPWAGGETWHYTGGPHGGWGVATAWAAVDFAPPTIVGCGAAPEWIVASAPGVVAEATDGLVLLDLDGDGFAGTGWVVVYLHVAVAGRVASGTVLATGDRIGHPSCEGGVSDGAHVHLARRLNGEWVPAADGPAPFVLSGWRFDSTGVAYDGGMTHPEHGARWPVAGRRDGPTGVVSDNALRP